MDPKARHPRLFLRSLRPFAANPSSFAAKERKGRKERQRTVKGPAYVRSSFQATEFATERRA